MIHRVADADDVTCTSTSTGFLRWRTRPTAPAAFKFTSICHLWLICHVA